MGIIHYKINIQNIPRMIIGLIIDKCHHHHHLFLHLVFIGNEEIHNRKNTLQQELNCVKSVRPKWQADLLKPPIRHTICKSVAWNFSETSLSLSLLYSYYKRADSIYTSHAYWSAGVQLGLCKKKYFALATAGPPLLLQFSQGKLTVILLLLCDFSSQATETSSFPLSFQH